MFAALFFTSRHLFMLTPHLLLPAATISSKFCWLVTPELARAPYCFASLCVLHMLDHHSPSSCLTLKPWFRKILLLILSFLILVAISYVSMPNGAKALPYLYLPLSINRKSDSLKLIMLKLSCSWCAYIHTYKSTLHSAYRTYWTN